jgi:Cys-tRNA(Pro)/Cys-tRNA(Cys) deacylase
VEKTNALRILDRLGLRYETASYPVDEADLSAGHVAQVLGLPEEQVFKTLLLRGDKTGCFVCCIPAPCEIDLKKAARVSGNKKADLVPLKELEPLTGYIRGGCSPIGMKKAFPTFLDETCGLHERIAVSAGRRGLQALIAPGDLLAATEGALADLI